MGFRNSGFASNANLIVFSSKLSSTSLHPSKTAAGGLSNLSKIDAGIFSPRVVLTTHMIAHPAQMEAGGSAEILARPIGIVSHPFGINTIMMTPTEREYVITQFAQTRDLVKQTFGGLSAPQLLYRPASGGWSAAENLEHLIVVERRVFAGIERLLQQPPDPAKRPAMTDEQIV